MSFCDQVREFSEDACLHALITGGHGDGCTVRLSPEGMKRYVAGEMARERIVLSDPKTLVVGSRVPRAAEAHLARAVTGGVVDFAESAALTGEEMVLEYALPDGSLGVVWPADIRAATDYETPNGVWSREE